MRVTLLSRASDLARLQAMLVGRALQNRFPDVDVTFATRVSAGDRDTTTPLASLTDKGAFTSDLSDALASGEADAVVHSWKDLPLEDRAGTTLAATLERADPRDVLLVRKEVLVERPAVLDILSSSPRREWLLQQVLRELLPWTVHDVRFLPVRGNITTRLSKLVRTPPQAHALVVAKAALDRLLGFGPPFEAAAGAVRDVLNQCAWMVLPIRDVPSAPAQAALAVETARDGEWRDRFRAISHQPTWNAVMAEREVLASYGGGCHEALGATVLPRPYGQVVSVRGRSSAGRVDRGWSLEDAGPIPPRTTPDNIWPRPGERHRARRRPVVAAAPRDDEGLWIARADALPETWSVSASRFVWAAGGKTWRRLAARGVWVHGSADGLGDAEGPGIDCLAGRAVTWRRLTHTAAAAGDPAALGTYAVDERLPEDCYSRVRTFSGPAERCSSRRLPVGLCCGSGGMAAGRAHLAHAAGRAWAGRAGARLARIRGLAQGRVGMTVTTETRAPWSHLRLRQSPWMRDLIAETTFSTAQLIQPLFVVEGMTGSSPVPGLGEVARQGEAALLDQISRDLDAGVRHFLLFSVPSAKREHALTFEHARRASAAIKGRFGDALTLWVDICLCSSTEHGHCALLDREGRIDLGPTLAALAQMALAVADAGADGVSPSDMMDGRTAHLRAALDEGGHQRVPIMSYSTKFASQFYGPFREAAGSAPQFGDRRHYQIDVRARRDAIASSVRCAHEGADLLMVKPGMTSIDLIGPIVEATARPVGAYQVSGEYAGLLALAAQGLVKLDAALLETWHVFRRAGAAYVITYGARDAKRVGL